MVGEENSREWLMELVESARSSDTKEAKVAAISAVPPSLVEKLLHTGAVNPSKESNLLGTGVAASPGVASGIVCLSSDAVLDATDLEETAILVCNETTPADEIGMRLADGIITARGGTASHAAVVARGWGIPAVVGVADLQISETFFTLAGVEIRSGEKISLNGTSGEVLLGHTEVEVTKDTPELDLLLSWADEVRLGKVAVRANADTGEDAARAKAFGAEGIGLCRTEHMFLGERLPLIQSFILAETEEEEKNSLFGLAEAQRRDLAEVIAAMAPYPVTVRLLDAPLHEFLGEQTPEEWMEHNPMLGMRGVRLAIVREELYRMQTRSLVGALIDLKAQGLSPRADIMIPLVSEAKELSTVREWVEEEISEVDPSIRPKIGTMIETPRAAVTASKIAEHADFFSFGTNDLTQLVFGFSRDDIESRIMSAYLEKNILSANPFENLDSLGVGELIDRAIQSGRGHNPDLEIGICGEHGGDPESISFLVKTGVDYVSCSPFRIPVARLALAQALIANEN